MAITSFFTDFRPDQHYVISPKPWTLVGINIVVSDLTDSGFKIFFFFLTNGMWVAVEVYFNF